MVSAIRSELKEIIYTMRTATEPIWAELNEMTACHEVMKTEPDPGMTQSVEEHQEIPKEDAVVKPVKGRKKRCRGRKLTAGQCGEPKELTRSNCGSRKKLGLQVDDPPCNSGMMQEKHLQKNWDPTKLWTTEETDCHRNKNDPPCKGGMA
jgi:hypothetical protein